MNKEELLHLEDEELNIKYDSIESLELFSGVIAHEFNNLLSGIQAWAQIGEKEKERKNIIKAFSSINEACKKGNYLAKSLMNFSRSQELNLSNLNLNELIDETVDLMLVQLKNKEITIEKDYNIKDEVMLDKTKMHQVFLNLLINAKDAIWNKGVIKIKTLCKDDMMQISISDNGHGITKENLKNIFKPFFTTKKNSSDGSSSGTGLGLSISRDIIRQHKGEIVVESTENVGTTFHIFLPLSLDENK